MTKVSANLCTTEVAAMNIQTKILYVDRQILEFLRKSCPHLKFRLANKMMSGFKVPVVKNLF